MQTVSLKIMYVEQSRSNDLCRSKNTISTALPVSRIYVQLFKDSNTGPAEALPNWSGQT